ncbi:shTK domain protein [Ancylostoma caninum]|uniref:ShTK domain protein n=1 Tax=Ancylostoma caninum TaxID=29170 RepID=A0A368FY83_ANCCA|nr:shTK domain protein [Ancylostoma caninum]
MSKIYGPRAVNCKNKYPDADCEALFGGPVKVNTDGDRDAKCYKNAATVADEARKELVISVCPKTCGYCCLTPPYNCKNKEFPRITCSSITEDMCASAKWKDIITQDCPNVCGFCQEGSCVDIAPGCAKDLTICRNVDMQQFVKEYCQRTCGFCAGSGGAASAACGANPNCANWIRNGFCDSRFYTEEQKKRYCGKACKLC